MSVCASIYGCSGTALTDEERRFFRDVRPWGFILFARNIDEPERVRRLIADLREAAGHEAEVLVDQEGGRVQRLRPPHWRAYPPGRRFGEIYEKDAETGLHAARLGAKLIAAELRYLGFTVDCLPVLDVPVPGAHDVIGDRAYSLKPGPVAALGLAASEGLLAGGVLPVIKHIPGHGRAGVDSHLSLPVVDTPASELEKIDFAPFHSLRHMPVAMTAHVVYSAYDAERPATTSPLVIDTVIRGHIGFDGLLMSDDLSMEALSGTLGERARESLSAGCDLVLHCNGKMEEMVAIAPEVPILSGDALRRSEQAISLRKSSLVPLDIDLALRQFSALTAVS